MKKQKEFMQELLDKINNRTDLHIVYKQKQKEIILHAFECLIENIVSLNAKDVNIEFIIKFIDDFVEERFVMGKYDDQDL